MKSLMGEEIEYAKSKRVRDKDGKFQYHLLDDDLMRQIFNQIIARQFSLQVYQDGFYLKNGGRLQNESCGNLVEICTPECLTLRDIVAHDKATELIAAKFCRDVRERLNIEIVLHKKNSDFRSDYRYEEGQITQTAPGTRGCHENYCVGAEFMEGILSMYALMEKEKDSFSIDNVSLALRHLLLFMTTRQILTGSGGFKITGRPEKAPEYFISPRAFHVGLNFGKATTNNETRGIIDKTRGIEPLADIKKYGRLHIICGDANMSEISVFLKFGMTAAVLAMIQNEAWDRRLIAEDPDWNALVFKAVSADLTCEQVPIRLLNGETYSAGGIQRLFQQSFHEYAAGLGFPEEFVFLDTLWAEALERLLRDDEGIYEMLDWKIKERLVKKYCDKHSLSFYHDRALTLDLEYHNVDPEAGVYNRLVNGGLVRRVISDSDIQRAFTDPPPNTRAALRRRLIDIFSVLNVKYTMKWEQISVKTERFPEFSFHPHTIMDLPDPFAYNAEVFDNEREKVKILIFEELEKRHKESKTEKREEHDQAGTD